MSSIVCETSLMTEGTGQQNQKRNFFNFRAQTKTYVKGILQNKPNLSSITE